MKKVLPWLVVPLAVIVIALGIWYVWGWFDVRSRAADAPPQAYFDKATYLWVEFPGGGIGPTAEAPLPEPDPAIVAFVGKHVWSIYPDNSAYMAHRAGDAEAPRVEVWRLEEPPSSDDLEGVGRQLRESIGRKYSGVTELADMSWNDAGLGGTRMNYKLKATDDAGRDRLLRFALLELEGARYLAWCNIPLDAPTRDTLDHIIASLRFRRQ